MISPSSLAFLGLSDPLQACLSLAVGQASQTSLGSKTNESCVFLELEEPLMQSERHHREGILDLLGAMKLGRLSADWHAPTYYLV
ncbi:hypothetical protein BDV34DRAFT_205424 [Aspergillus parasiticus]|uniref:Uncharacterized protein n=1 Tax=Aspergillus parasiticus TaxID=5067 RepID=A0A5N6D4N0_ASPPA|nr:hypothetical protein BDV34DRAFT_205424 [Aspergillus parasiticus]